MSIWYEINNKTEAKKVLLRAFNEGRLVSLVCGECKLGPTPIEKMYVNVVHIGNVVVKYAAIKEIIIHQKASFSDSIVRYLQREDAI